MTAKNRIAKYLWTFIKYFSLILAGFIAFSVAGRAALAPAMIGAMVRPTL